jgi:hypothetical protein
MGKISGGLENSKFESCLKSPLGGGDLQTQSTNQNKPNGQWLKLLQ